VIAYQRVLWREELDGTRIYQFFGFMVPTWRRKGIGRAMFHQAERRIIEIAATHPNSGSRFFESDCADTEIGKETLFIHEGYKDIRHEFVMVRPDLENIPDLRLPEGVEIRPVLPEHLQKINDASKEAFQDDWGFSPDLEHTVEQWVEDPNYDPTLWRVAWEGDQVVGMVLNFIDARANEEYHYKRGWTENICVRRPWRKKGIAKALIAASLHAIKERGMQEAALGVDTENISGALKLYESMGYRPIKRFSIYRKPLKI
jgi:mycothiol synthase